MELINKKIILIIDDDEDILNWFRILQKNDLSCTYFFLKDKQETQNAIVKLKSDLIFLEHNEEKLSETLRIASGFKTSVVHMSTQNHSHASFMRKPLERKAVETKIRELLKI